MNSSNNMKQSPHRRRRKFSWTYDDDHHIGQYSDENTLLPINEAYVKSECDNENSYDGDGCETDNDSEMELCETDASRQQTTQQSQQQTLDNPQNFSSANGVGKRRRRSLRKALGKAWDIPSQVAMQRRNRFRQIVDDETMRHRRIHPRSNAQGQTNENGATIEPMPINVLDLLKDREIFGSSGMRSLRSVDTGASQFTVGVPIRSVDSENEDNTPENNRRRRRRNRRSRNQTNGNANEALPNDATTTATNALNSYSQRYTTDELRTYAEQACVTKFESSYLSHLQHDEIEEEPPQEAASNETAGNSTSGGSNNNDNRTSNGTSANAQSNGTSSSASSRQQSQNSSNTSSKAVSTISIAFSPDGKTMASTHGDHTVKITCCITGRLLQTLVGHPRTPWTVKYHPHAGADLKNPKTQKVVIANRTATTNSILNNISSNTASQEDSTQQQQREQQLQEQYDRQQIVASGCLGHQVRIWDWVSGTCLQMIRLDFAIISLSFHPAGNVLAIANGTRLHFWGLPTVIKAQDESQSGESAPENGTNTSSSQLRRGMHIEMRHMLRCVHFLPDGKRVIVGGVNPQTHNEIRRQRRLAAEGNTETAPTMSFYLRLWDFDLEAARGPPSVSRQALARQGNAASAQAAPRNTADEGGANNTTTSQTTNTSAMTQQRAIIESTQAAAAAAAALGTTTRRRRAITNPRCFVPRALLYNDGGFDVSPDGKTLCACAEYWLPEGVNNATDLLHPRDNDDYYGDSDDDSSSDESSYCSDKESEKPSDSKEENDVEMDDTSGDEAKKHENSAEGSKSKTDGNDKETVESSGITAAMSAKEDETSTEKSDEESKRDASSSSPTRYLASSSSSQPSATPPRIASRQPQNIASPPLGVGTGVGASSSAYGVPMPPIQAGMTPQTPPPNVNPLNFPLSPPSPPGRRFAGGLTRGTQPQSQQHEQLLQQYNRQQAILNQHRLNLQQQGMPPPQHQRVGTVSTPPSRGTESASATIPAPPRINHRNNRQHRLHTHKPGSSIQKAGNPFGGSGRGGVNPHTQRGRYVPHVVTISLDTEPYVETTTEEVLTGHIGPTISSDASSTASGRIRTTTVTETTSQGRNPNTTIVTKTTYNIPGRGAAFSATRPHVLERRPRLGQLLSACPLDTTKASAVTCVKFSPCTDFCLIGYGVREPHVEESNGDTNAPPEHPPYHPVTAMYKVNRGGNMRHVATMLSGDDDVNISRFHPDSGYGFVYGTKQGRIRILGPRPWNYYNC